MRRRLLKWLVCPLCHSSLNLVEAEIERRECSQSDYVVFESTRKIEDPGEVQIEVITGALTCTQCCVYYPISNSVPRILSYPTPVARIHAEQNANWVRQNLSG